MAASEALIKRLRFCWLTLTRDEIHQAADHIEKLEADKARLNDALRQAVIDAAEWARKAGEAQGKLEISEAAGVLDGWIQDCERLRADNARLREALGVWDDKTVWVQKTVQPHEIGLHRADVLRHRVEAQAREIERLHETLRSRGVVIEYKRGFSAGDGDSAVLQETSHDA